MRDRPECQAGLSAKEAELVHARFGVFHPRRQDPARERIHPHVARLEPRLAQDQTWSDSPGRVRSAWLCWRRRRQRQQQLEQYSSRTDPTARAALIEADNTTPLHRTIARDSCPTSGRWSDSTHATRTARACILSRRRSISVRVLLVVDWAFLLTVGTTDTDPSGQYTGVLGPRCQRRARPNSCDQHPASRFPDHRSPNRLDDAYGLHARGSAGAPSRHASRYRAGLLPTL